MDADGYPDDAELSKITNWPYEDGWRELLEYVASLWTYKDYMYTNKRAGIYELSTGGWSGNEDLINALSENLVFWGMCWFSSRRGGKHEFRIDNEDDRHLKNCGWHLDWHECGCGVHEGASDTV